MKDLVVTEAPKPSADWWKPARFGIGVVVLVFGVCGGWAAFARLDAGAVASGVVAVESNRRTVQHLEGGIVKELRVRDGDAVEAGAVLLRLDQTRAGAGRDLLRQQLVQAMAEEARLVAERDGAAKMSVPAELAGRAREPGVAAILADQEKQFEARRRTLLSQTEIIDAQMVQIRREIEAVTAERRTAEEQLKFVARDLEGLRDLLAKRLVQTSRVTEQEREYLKLQAAVARANVDAVQAGQRIDEGRMKKEQLRQEYHRDAVARLTDVRKLVNDMRQQIIVAEDTLRRVEVVAPIAGTVQGLRVFTVGGVLRPGEAILDIVPRTDDLVIRARIRPIDADRVHTGMPAQIRFPSFSSENLPPVPGVVRIMSRDRIIDEATRDSYFAAEVAVDRSTLPPEVAARLVAGLPADVVVPSEARTALLYLLSPLTARLGRADGAP